MWRFTEETGAPPFIWPIGARRVGLRRYTLHRSLTTERKELPPPPPATTTPANPAPATSTSPHRRRSDPGATDRAIEQSLGGMLPSLDRQALNFGLGWSIGGTPIGKLHAALSYQISSAF